MLSLGEFVTRFHLHDRGLDCVRRENGEVAFTFSLFHCDDPHRDDESKDYTLVAVFAEGNVSARDECLFSMTLQHFAEVMEVKFDGGTLALGISWETSAGHDWTGVEITGAPLRVHEKVTPRSDI